MEAHSEATGFPYYGTVLVTKLTALSTEMLG